MKKRRKQRHPRAKSLRQVVETKAKRKMRLRWTILQMVNGSQLLLASGLRRKSSKKSNISLLIWS